MFNKTLGSLVLLIGLGALACTSDPLFPSPDNVEVRVHVTGGIAGVDYTIGVDGSTGIVTGIECASQCSFQDGEQLLRLPERQLDDLIAIVFETGIRSGNQDFGDGGCCDHFGYTLTWIEPGLEHTIIGSSATLPELVMRAIDAVSQLSSGAQPVVVQFGTPLETWPLDALEFRDVSVDGDIMSLTLEHGGGCETHAYGLVAWDGWLESNPVQVQASLIHEDFDDPCDALVTTDHSFDLRPLRSLYQADYGPGPDTILIRLTAPGQPTSEAITVSYAF